MDRKSFGRLIRALREESRIRRPDGYRVSQKELARQLVSLQQRELEDDNVNRMYNTLARVEQGRKKQFDSALLSHLATAFELTSKEREKFFLAATGIESEQQVNQNLPHMKDILEDLEKLVANVQSPAMLIDFHGDIVMFNDAMLKIYGQSAVTLSQLPVLNLWLALFELPTPDWRRDYIEERTIQNIRFLRADSLLHRNDDYFVRLLDYAVGRYSPQFSILWQRAYKTSDYFTNSIVHSHHHGDFGRLEYMNSISTTVTQRGTLSLLTYVPLNRKTDQDFLKLASQQVAVRVPTWPEHKARGKELFR
jgi:PAS domain-containing protein